MTRAAPARSANMGGCGRQGSQREEIPRRGDNPLRQQSIPAQTGCGKQLLMERAGVARGEASPLSLLPQWARAARPPAHSERATAEGASRRAEARPLPLARATRLPIRRARTVRAPCGRRTRSRGNLSAATGPSRRFAVPRAAPRRPAAAVREATREMLAGRTCDASAVQQRYSNGLPPHGPFTS